MSTLQPESRPNANLPGVRIAQRVLFVGWDGANPATLTTLLAAGRLPHLKRLLDRGARISLEVPRPILSPIAWTSLATGKRAHEHGILHAFEPDSEQMVPVTRRHRHASAIWNILHRAGLRAHAVGWPVSHP